MDQVKIGKYIQEKRNQVNKTQSALAEELGVSKNAVSKWERGICLMDMSLLKPLSEILHVSVNEILAGEDIKNSELKTKSDENIVNMASLLNLKNARISILCTLIIFLILIIISISKELHIAPLISFFLGSYSLILYNYYNLNKNKVDLIGSIIFTILFIANTLIYAIIY